MRKLKLDLDALAVASFTTARSGSRRGTVLGAQDTQIEGSPAVYPEYPEAEAEQQAQSNLGSGWYFVTRGWGDLYTI